MTNKATAATSTMNSEVYNGYHRNFTLETNYTIMQKTFNNLADSGSAHALNYTNKINSFEKGLKDTQEIHWCIISK